jgi:membrane protease YdiL (CAAX protease family)
VDVSRKKKSKGGNERAGSGHGVDYIADRSSGDNSSGTVKSLVSGFVRDFSHLDRNITITIIAAVVLNVISYYFGSRRFYREALVPYGPEGFEQSIHEFTYWFSSEFVLLFVIPAALVLLVHKRPLKDAGLGLGDWRTGLKVTGIFMLIMLPVTWIASGSPEFQAVYPHARIARLDWGLFAYYEAIFLLYFTGWEYIWRGYVLFGLERHTGSALANLIQMVPFVLLHNGKPVLETLGAIAAGLALGALALRTRSFWYCVLTHWLVMFSIDLFCTIRR